MNKFLKFLKRIITSTPISATRLFLEVHRNEPYHNKAFKRALLYGIFYFYQTPKDNRGGLDYNARSEYQDKVIQQYTNPTDRLQYLKDLKSLRNGVNMANRCGYFSVGDNKEQNKIEAGYYDEIITCLDSLILYTYLYPTIWKKIFSK